METVNCICYVDRKKLKFLNSNSVRVNNIEVIVNIPTIKMLKKLFKGEQHYEDAPIMLNYGFITLPKHKVNDEFFLKNITVKLPYIVGFLKIRRDKRLSIATATDEEIKRVIKQASKLSIYSGMDFNTKEGREEIRRKYEPYINKRGEAVDGKIVTLKGYPFDNVDAQIIKIKFSKEEVDVLLNISLDGEEFSKPATISFENLFYTVYSDSTEDEMREVYLDDLTQGYNNPELLTDKIIYNGNEE